MCTDKLNAFIIICFLMQSILIKAGVDITLKSSENAGLKLLVEDCSSNNKHLICSSCSSRRAPKHLLTQNFGDVQSLRMNATSGRQFEFWTGYSINYLEGGRGGGGNIKLRQFNFKGEILSKGANSQHCPLSHSQCNPVSPYSPSLQYSPSTFQIYSHSPHRSFDPMYIQTDTRTFYLSKHSTGYYIYLLGTKYVGTAMESFRIP